MDISQPLDEVKKVSDMEEFFNHKGLTEWKIGGYSYKFRKGSLNLLRRELLTDNTEYYILAKATKTSAKSKVFELVKLEQQGED